MTKQTISIIGAGLSGTLVALNCIRKATEPIHIRLIDSSGKFGLGAAYSTEEDYHLLNVPAYKMGAYSGEIDHFYNWLKTNGYSYSQKSFVPRKIYGKYIQSLLDGIENNLSPSVTFEKILDEIIDIKVENGAAMLRSASGKVLYSDKVVLAVGNYAPVLPPVRNTPINMGERYHANPWSKDVFTAIKPHETVFIIGTGLTMVDTVLSLYYKGHRGKIIALSKNGYLPGEHMEFEHYPSFTQELMRENSVNHYFRVIHRHLKIARNNWHGVISSFRPDTQLLWMRLPKTDKARFLRHLNSLWSVARHRMAPECTRIIKQLGTNGGLQVFAGRIQKIENSDSSLLVTYRGKKSTSSNTFKVNHVINCTGINHDFSKIDHPLMQSLYKQGLVRNDELNIGFDVSIIGEIINKEGMPSPVLFAVGPPTKGIFWEIIAAPEIRQQTATLARRLVFPRGDLNTVLSINSKKETTQLN